MLLNTVFSWNKTNYRLIHQDSDNVWIFPLENTSPTCKVVSLKEFNLEQRANKIVEIADPFAELQHRKASTAEINKGEQGFRLIEPLLADEVGAYNSKNLKSKIQELSYGYTDTTERLSFQRKLKRTLIKWWQRGQVPAALFPDYAPKTEVRNYTKKPGVTSELTAKAPPLDNEIREAFDKICREHLLVEHPVSVDTAHGIFIDYWKEKKKVSAEECPTINQFRNYYVKKYPKGSRSSKQSSIIANNKDLKSLQGNVYDIVKGIGHIYEIDSTVDNVYLLSDDRKNVIGRPTLYVVGDVFSGSITGFHLSFESAQYKTAGHALFNAMRNKVEYCKELGLEISHRLWYAEGVPAEITADNAELTGEQILNLTRAYGVQVNSTRSYMGSDKGTVEQLLGIIQEQVKSLLKHRGLVIQNVSTLAKAGYQDSRKDAVLTLGDYEKIVARAVLLANTRVKEVIPPDLPPTVKPTPNEIWKYYESHGRSLLRKEQKQELLKLSVLPHYPCTVSRKGINVLHIRYHCEDREYLTMIKRCDKQERPKDWMMVVDPGNVSKAWLQKDSQHRPLDYIECHLAPSSRHLKDLTLNEALDYLKKASPVRKIAELEYRENKGETYRENLEIVKQAEQNKSEDFASLKEQLKNIKDNSRKEKNLKEKQLSMQTQSDKREDTGHTSEAQQTSDSTQGQTQTAQALNSKEPQNSSQEGRRTRKSGIDFHSDSGNVDRDKVID